MAWIACWRVLVYLGDVICFDEDPVSHVANMVEFSRSFDNTTSSFTWQGSHRGYPCQLPRPHHLPNWCEPRRDNVRALTHMPNPDNIKQLVAFLVVSATTGIS